MSVQGLGKKGKVVCVCLPDILFLAGNPGRGPDFAALVHVHGGAAMEEAERR